MTLQMTERSPRRLGRSIAAVACGFMVTAILSLATDQLFHALEVFPPWGQPMQEPADNLLALTYRCAYAVLGCYLAARLAPREPMRHALILGAIGFVVGLAGASAALQMDLGPVWYPVAVVATALPCAWAGGALHRR